MILQQDSHSRYGWHVVTRSCEQREVLLQHNFHHLDFFGTFVSILSGFDEYFRQHFAY